VFEAEGLNKAYAGHRKMLERAVKVGDTLKGRFHDMSDAIDAILIAAITGEALLLIGPPGTAKSRVIRSFCNLIGLLPDSVLQGDGRDEARSDAYFEYLLTQFTEPSELFGFFDIPKLMEKDGQMVRLDDGMMQRAQIVFLDEVFNASSAILNSLLTFMNERRFHDRGRAIPTNLRLLVSATNHTPTEPHLAAVYDRFLLRCRLENVAQRATREADLVHLLNAAWSESHAPRIAKSEKDTSLLEAFAGYRDSIDQMTADGTLRINPQDPVFAELNSLVILMVKHGLSDMSNRRLVKMTGIVMCARMLRAAREGQDKIAIERSDLAIILKYSVDHDDPSAISRIRQELGWAL